MTVSTQVVGAGPISFTDSTGAQRSVPLSSLVFKDSVLALASLGWETAIPEGADRTGLLAVATARQLAGELLARAVPKPAPAVVVTAGQAGAESNGILLDVHQPPSEEPRPAPPSMPISLRVRQQNTYPGLASATAVEDKIGLDTPAGATGLVVVKSGSVAAGTDLPAPANPYTFSSAQPTADVAASSGAVLFTLVPRIASMTQGLTVTIDLAADGTTFTLTVAYDSDADAIAPVTFTLQTLDNLPAPVKELVTLSAPPGGARPPADGDGMPLTGGGPGRHASTTLYDS